jgi:stress-induced morphogen
MPLDALEIERLIRDSFPDALVEVQDLRGNEEHYAAYVESRSFGGKPRLDQHRMVFRALQGHVGTSLRTMTLKTAIPEGCGRAKAG